MYFQSRVVAGKQLADELTQYKNTKTAIIALSDGGVVVGAQIASALQCPLTLLLIEPIDIPGERDPVAVINQDGVFTYNHMYAPGELEEFDMEYHQYIEAKKLEKLHNLHQMMGSDTGLIRKDLLEDHVVILVTDGMSSGFSLEAAVDYLKPVRTKKLIAATPLASVPAVDRMHILTDEIHCLSVIQNYIGTNHYYEDNAIPSHSVILKTIKNLIHHWK